MGEAGGEDALEFAVEVEVLEAESVAIGSEEEGAAEAGVDGEGLAVEEFAVFLAAASEGEEVLAEGGVLMDEAGAVGVANEDGAIGGDGDGAGFVGCAFGIVGAGGFGEREDHDGVPIEGHLEGAAAAEMDSIKILGAGLAPHKERMGAGEIGGHGAEEFTLAGKDGDAEFVIGADIDIAGAIDGDATVERTDGGIAGNLPPVWHGAEDRGGSAGGGDGARHGDNGLVGSGTREMRDHEEGHHSRGEAVRFHSVVGFEG